MSDPLMDDQASLEALSAMADGRASAAEVARAVAAWRDDPEARQRWSTYHLIGDAMRSEELAAGRPSSDFLKSFRQRLAQEPVILAPAGLTAPRPGPSVVDVEVSPPLAQLPLRRRIWAGPMAVAACFVMIVGALVSTQSGLPGGEAGGAGLAFQAAPTFQGLALSPQGGVAGWDAFDAGLTTTGGSSFNQMGQATEAGSSHSGAPTSAEALDVLLPASAQRPPALRVVDQTGR